MNLVEEIIDELEEDSCELYHKNRDILQKKELLEDMIQRVTEQKKY